jgi:hypothetical protein
MTATQHHSTACDHDIKTELHRVVVVHYPGTATDRQPTRAIHGARRVDGSLYLGNFRAVTFLYHTQHTYMLLKHRRGVPVTVTICVSSHIGIPLHAKKQQDPRCGDI